MKNKIFLIGIVGIIVIISIIFFTTIKPQSQPIDNEKEFEKEFDNKSVEDVKKEFLSNPSIISKIPKKFYIIPEFYPNFNKDNIIRGQLGYGAYPGDASYNTTEFKTGQYLDVYTFVLSSFGVSSYQGLGLVLQSPDDNLFETTVEPSAILLNPLNITNPEKTNWTYKIKMGITAKKDIPEGIYLFKLRAKAPSIEKSKEFTSKLNSTDRYMNGAMIQTEKFFDFTLYLTG